MTRDRRYSAVVLFPQDDAVDGAQVAGRLARLPYAGVHVAEIHPRPPDVALHGHRPGSGCHWLCTPMDAGHDVVTRGPDGATSTRVPTAALASWLLGQFWGLGVGLGLTAVLGSQDAIWKGVAGVMHVEDVLGFLDDQVARRDNRRVPDIDQVPGWSLDVADHKPHLRRVHETLLTLGDTRFATRGTPSDPAAGHEPLVAANGVYTHPEGPGQHLLAAPTWMGFLGLRPSRTGELEIDLTFRQPGTPSSCTAAITAGIPTCRPTTPRSRSTPTDRSRCG